MNTDKPTPDILKMISGVPLDSGRDSLMDTINQAVDAVIEGVRGNDPGRPLPQETINSTLVALKFLSACAGIGDDEFRAFVRGRAQQLQTIFEQASAAMADGSTKEEAVATDPAFRSFDEAFVYFLGKFIRAKLACFVLTGLEPSRPFILNEHFVDVFVTKAVEYLSPAMLANRRLQTVAQGYGPEDLVEVVFYGEFLKPERENTTHILWHSGIIDLRDGLSAPEAGSASRAKSADAGATGLMGKLMGKGKKPPAAASKPDPQQEKRRRAQEFWAALQSDAETHGYDAPQVTDFVLFDVIFEFEEEVIIKQQKAISQLLAQEGEESGEGRAGATRDFLGRVMDLLPPHCGEIVALWAYRRHPDLFLPEIVKSFLSGQATSVEKRKKMLPLFTRWVPDPAESP